MGGRDVQETIEKGSLVERNFTTAQTTEVPSLPIVVPVSCFLKVNLAFEGVAARLRRWRLHLISMITMLLRAESASCTHISRAELDYKSLPLDEEFTSWLDHQRLCGRQIILLSDAPAELCDLIAKRLKQSPELAYSPPT